MPDLYSGSRAPEQVCDEQGTSLRSSRGQSCLHQNCQGQQMTRRNEIAVPRSLAMI